jgi:8-oxo-dGTP diphosphatase
VVELDSKGRVRAAGGVIEHDDRICVIHRPRYEDWSLPKGKLDAGERFEDAAIREVREETGLEAACVAELTPHEYVDRKGRPKVVRWWRMTVAEVAPFVVNDEVDERRWVTPEEAEELLDYEHDRALVREALGRD